MDKIENPYTSLYFPLSEFDDMKKPSKKYPMLENMSLFFLKAWTKEEEENENHKICNFNDQSE